MGDFPKGRRVVLGANGFIGKHLMAACPNFLGLTRKDVDLSEETAGNRLAGLLRDEDTLFFLSAITPDKGRDAESFMKNCRMAGALDIAPLPEGFTGYWHGPNNPYNEANLGGPEVPIPAGVDPAVLAQLQALQGGSHMDNSTVSDAGTFVLTETSLDLHCWGQNPVVTAKLQLNGQDRFSEREGSYFSWVQPYQAHTRCPDEGINVYSFALRPEEHQPSGTCNFSRIDNATLQLVLSNATVEGTKTAKVRVYATNYNVLRIMSGMGGLAYSN